MFPHISEFSLIKNGTIQLESFLVSRSEDLLIVWVVEGKFEWLINQRHYVLYPGDTAVVMPGQEIGGSNGQLDIGSFVRLQIAIESVPSEGKAAPGRWSNLSKYERVAVGKILVLNELPVLKVKEVPGLMQELRAEIAGQEVGFVTRVNHLLDCLLIHIARQSTRQASSRRDFSQAFMALEKALRQNLAHQWTVEEMAAIMGLGTTAFTERVKSYTGFAPLHYLINIRIAEAVKQLKRPGVSLTDIALETGFYSSQHFSTTFKKLTGHTPGQFRKRNSPND